MRLPFQESGSRAIRVRRATVDDLPEIVRIHKIAYSRNHFTALLPDQALKNYYALFLDGGPEIHLAIGAPETSSFDPKRGDAIEGFAVYGRDIPRRIARFKREQFRSIFLTSLRHPIRAAGKILARFFARFSRSVSCLPTDFLLLSIAVAIPRCGMGKILLGSMLDDARAQGVKTVGLYVNTDNVGAVNAYFSAGFIVMGSQGGQFYMEQSFD